MFYIVSVKAVMVDEPLDIVYELRERRYITAKLRRWQRNLQNILEENTSDVSNGDSLKSQSVVVSPSSCRLRQSSVETASTSTSRSRDTSRDTSRDRWKSRDKKDSRSSLSSQSVVVSRQRKHSSLYSSYSTLSAGTHRKFSYQQRKEGSYSPNISTLAGGGNNTSSFIPSISSHSPSVLPDDLDLPNCVQSLCVDLPESNSLERKISSKHPQLDNRNRNSKSDEIESPGGGKEKPLEIDRKMSRDGNLKSRDHADLHDDVTDPICISINYFTPNTTSAVGNQTFVCIIYRQ